MSGENDPSGAGTYIRLRLCVMSCELTLLEIMRSCLALARLRRKEIYS